MASQNHSYSFEAYAPSSEHKTSLIFSFECDIILYQADYDSLTEISCLLAESFNCAVIDCGTFKTLCDKIWLKVLVESIPKELSDTIHSTVKVSLYIW